jgi:hypothetical protein
LTVHDDLGDLPLTGHVVALVDAARGPATAEELAREAEVVAAMVSAQQAAVGADRPHGPLRLVGRVVAAKGVAMVGVVVFGVAAAAAAATTGVVASVVSSDGDDSRPPVTTTSTSTSTPPTTGDPTGVVVEDRSDRIASDSEDLCAAVIVECAPSTGAGHEAQDTSSQGSAHERETTPPGHDRSPAVPSAEPEAPDANGTNGTGNGATAGGGNPPVTLPPQATDAPGHSEEAPAPPHEPSTPGGDRRHGSASTRAAAPPPGAATEGDVRPPVKPAPE